MENNGNQAEISKEFETYGKLFINFVDTHEQFYGALDKGGDKEYGHSIYEKQKR